MRHLSVMEFEWQQPLPLLELSPTPNPSAAVAAALATLLQHLSSTRSGPISIAPHTLRRTLLVVSTDSKLN